MISLRDVRGVVVNAGDAERFQVARMRLGLVMAQVRALRACSRPLEGAGEMRHRPAATERAVDEDDAVVADRSP